MHVEIFDFCQISIYLFSKTHEFRIQIQTFDTKIQHQSNKMGLFPIVCSYLQNLTVLDQIRHHSLQIIFAHFKQSHICFLVVLNVTVMQLQRRNHVFFWLLSKDRNRFLEKREKNAQVNKDPG